MKHVRLLFLLLPILLNAGLTVAQPCYSGYQFRQPVIINNQGAPQLFNHQLHIQLNTQNLIAANKLKANGADIRILDRVGSPLTYYLDSSSINSSQTSIWVKTDSIKGYNNDTLYLFYGNPSAVSGSSASSTFLFYDEFNGSSLGSAWSSCGASPTISSGKLTLKGSTKSAIYSNATFANPVIAEIYVDTIIGKGAFMGLLNSSMNGYGMYNDSNNYYIGGVGSSGTCFSATPVNTGAALSQTKGKWTFLWQGASSQIATGPNGSFSATNAMYTPSSALNALLAQTDTAGALVIDKIVLRSYTSSSLGISYGQEISVVYTISPSYNNPICEGLDLRLTVDSIAGAVYTWSGPNSFSATVRNPVIPSATSVHQGLYTINVDIPSGCASKSSSVNVSIIAKAKGGTLTGSASVCAASNGGTMTLNSFLGNIISWDSASNINGPWFSIIKTNQNHTFNNLLQTTHYRVIVGNGNCSVDSSSVATIVVTPASIGGSVSGSDSVCESTNSGVLTLSGYTGSITKWESSENGFLWNSISNPSTTQSYSGLIKTTFYRAIVKNGICNEEKSSIAVITVNKTTVPGTAGPSQVVCLSSNQGFVKLSGYTGAVLAWERSVNNGITWTSINTTVDSIAFVNITQNTLYRAYVKNGKCGGSYSTIATISISSPSVAGTIAGSTEVCEGSSSGVLTLSGYQGTIIKWQSKSVKSNAWSDISNVNATYNWSSLSDTTSFRALVGNSTCAYDTSTIATIKVNPTSQSGYIGGTDRVCETNGNGLLFLGSYIGKVLDWEVSNNGYSNWNAINNQTDSLTLTNLSQTKYYRAIVKSGQCAKVYSSIKSVGFDKVSIAGSLGSTQELCESNNYGVFSLSGFRGDVQKWQYTKGSTWIDINSTQSSYTFTNLTDSTWFRSIVKNGVCNLDTSNTAKVVIYPVTSAGSITGNNALCIANANTTLYLKNYTGNIKKWEQSNNGSSSWTALSSVDDSINIINLTQTTYYRAIVQSGSCSNQYTAVFKVQVDTLSQGGYFVANQEACENNNFGALALLGSTGTIQKWQINTGSSWADIANTTINYNWSNLTGTSYFRAIAQNGVCVSDTSSEVSVKVFTTSAVGAISGNDNVCLNNASGVLKLAGYNGSIIGWESSTNSSTGFSSVSNTSDSLVYTNLLQTTYYKVEVKNGVCPASKTNAFVIKVDALSKGGSFAGNQEVCENNNFGALTLINSNGTILKWQKNTGSAWTDIPNASTLYNWNNLNGTNWFRAIVKNGICSEDTSAQVRVIVYTNSDAGLVTGNDKLCINNANGVLKLTGHNGQIVDWKSSTNATAWNSLSTTADSLVYNSLAQTTYYKVEVKNGACAVATSAVFGIRVDTLSIGGLLSSDQDVCTDINSGTLKLTASNGTIVRWEQLVDTTSNWATINKVASDRYDFLNLKYSSAYRVTVQNGVCPETYSNTVNVKVWSKTTAGTLSGSTTFCNLTNNGTIQLNNNNGSVTKWLTSVDNGINWNDVISSDSFINYINLPSTTLFKAVIQNGVCAVESTNSAKVEVFEPSSVGTIVSGDTVFCQSASFGTIKLANANYTNNTWQKSDNNGIDWSDVASNQAIYYFNQLNKTSWFRAIAKNQTCTADTSSTIVVRIVDATLPGSLNSFTPVCASSGKVVLKNTGYNGEITNWSIASDANGPWSNLGWFADSLVISNPLVSRFYRTSVKNEICPEVITASTQIVVHSKSSAGLLTGNANVCIGSNQGQLVLNGYNGDNIKWRKSLGAAYVVEAGTSATLNYQDLTNATSYYAIVSNGVCAEDTSNTVSINLFSMPVVDFSFNKTCTDALSHFADLSTGGNIMSRLWQMNDGYRNTDSAFNRSFAIPGNYDVALTVTTTDGCAISTNKFVDVYESPIAHFSYQNQNGDQWGCDNDSVWMFNLSMSSASSNNYNWQFSDGTSDNVENPTKQFKTPGVYTIALKITTAQGCEDSTSKTISIVGHNKIAIAAPTKVSMGMPFAMQAPEGYVNYLWSGAALFETADARVPQVTLTTPGYVYLKVTDRYGCSSTDSAFINTENDFKIRPNNVITPEGNGQNDVWVVTNLENYPNNTVRLYDRWGRMVYEANNYQNTWNGEDQNGKTLADGTYYYVISFKDSKAVYKGAITLIRNK